jgi:uncharacterized protein (TIGR00369 family)
MDKLQYLNDNPLPFARLLGLKFVAASETGVTAEMVVRPDLCTRPDILHGGAVMAFADTLGAAATVVNLPEGKTTATLESKTNFVGPAPVGATVIGETTPVHLGRRTHVWTTRVTTREGKLVAVVTQTQMVL